MKIFLLLIVLTTFTNVISSANILKATELLEAMKSEPFGEYNSFALGWIAATNGQMATRTIPNEKSDGDGWYINCTKDKSTKRLYNEFRAYLENLKIMDMIETPSAIAHYQKYYLHYCKVLNKF